MLDSKLSQLFHFCYNQERLWITKCDEIDYSASGITKCQGGLQIVTGITKCDEISKCGGTYVTGKKIRQNMKKNSLHMPKLRRPQRLFLTLA